MIFGGLRLTTDCHVNATKLYLHFEGEAILYLRGNCTPNQNLACFVLYLKIVNTFLQIDVCQGARKWHWNFSRPSGF